MSDPLFITPEQAESLLIEGADYIHNYMSGPMMLIGCDYERVDAIKHFKEADSIEIGGETCQSMKHPIVAIAKGRASFFEADMEKVAAFEQARASA